MGASFRAVRGRRSADGASETAVAFEIKNLDVITESLTNGVTFLPLTQDRTE
jgi:hypothetical protein